MSKQSWKVVPLGVKINDLYHIFIKTYDNRSYNNKKSLGIKKITNKPIFDFHTLPPPTTNISHIIKAQHIKMNWIQVLYGFFKHD